jgi:DNA N-6-adenine-methyltransferase (Dam)
MTAPLLALAVDLDQYLVLDQRIDGNERDAILGRWEFGRLLLAERDSHAAGKQLPHGRIDELCKALGKSASELRYRIQFAEHYPTAEKVSTALETFGSWTAIRDYFSKRALNQSDSNEWCTPALYVEASRRTLRTIDLDPASSEVANETVKATHFFTLEDDGLSQQWIGNVFLNSPYRGQTPAFVKKLVDEYKAGNVTAAIVLVNSAATPSLWFQLLWEADALCFTDHHINFVPGPGVEASGSPHGGIFAYFGPEPERFYAEFQQFGAIVRRWQP